MLSPLEKRAINLTWAKPFDGNSPLLRYILEVSENSKGLPRLGQAGPCHHPGAASRGCCRDLGDHGAH